MKNENTKIALGKWMAQSGFSSRRKAADLIKTSHIKVNGKIINTPFTLIDPQVDIIFCDGKTIDNTVKLEYYLINKPSGFVSSTVTDSSNAPPVTSLIRSKIRLYPVGRLDIESAGLLIITNDGDLTNKLTHPKFEVEKRYEVEVVGHLTLEKINQLEFGIKLGTQQTAPCKIEIVEQSGNRSNLMFIIHQGLNRQIRRMCAAVDLHVKSLTRTHIKDLSLGSLGPGEYRKLTSTEVKNLKTVSAS